MSDKIVVTLQELNTEEVITLLSPVPLVLFDSAYPSLAPELRKKILKGKYKKGS